MMKYAPDFADEMSIADDGDVVMQTMLSSESRRKKTKLSSHHVAKRHAFKMQEENVPGDIINSVINFLTFRETLYLSLTSRGWQTHCNQRALPCFRCNPPTSKPRSYTR